MPDSLPADLIDTLRRDLFPDAMAILLYGSRATGRHRADSDVDLYVVTPGLGPLIERRVLRGGLTCQIAIVPHAVLAQLSEMSLRARRPIGLFGLAEGVTVYGDLPDLDDLARGARDTIANIDNALRPETDRKMQAALETAEMALGQDDAGGRALALRAVPMLLEAELHVNADIHITARSRFRRLAQADPDRVDAYAAVCGALAAGDTAPLAALVYRLRKTHPKPTGDTVVRHMQPAQLGYRG